jgi:hypothetical protein
MLVNLFSFAADYFFESGLFNGLQPIQIKKSPPFFVSRLRLCQGHFRRMSFTFLPPIGLRLRLASGKACSTDPGFRKEIAHKNPLDRTASTSIRGFLQVAIFAADGQKRSLRLAGPSLISTNPTPSSRRAARSSLAQHQRIDALRHTADGHDGYRLHHDSIDHGH